MRERETARDVGTHSRSMETQQRRGFQGAKAMTIGLAQ